ncbi:MAG TPA: hypothetical protein VMQ50_15320 [Casimicrobiaceae bacterium]|nr:hypothetical protein [Casimicrobiaceae bacterium]
MALSGAALGAPLPRLRALLSLRARYRVNGVAQVKTIARESFKVPGTRCQ